YPLVTVQVFAQTLFIICTGLAGGRPLIAAGDGHNGVDAAGDYRAVRRDVYSADHIRSDSNRGCDSSTRRFMDIHCGSTHGRSAIVERLRGSRRSLVTHPGG